MEFFLTQALKTNISIHRRREGVEIEIHTQSINRGTFQTKHNYLTYNQQFEDNLKTFLYCSLTNKYEGRT